MMTIGPANLIDALCWVFALALGSKVVATLVLLVSDRGLRDQPGWGAMLWWTTRLAPVVFVPCFIWIELLRGATSLVLVGLALMLSMGVTVPMKVRQRRNRIAERLVTEPHD